MLKDIQVTLYDFFGYLLPGGVILLSLIVLFWTLFWPGVPLVVSLDLSTPAIFSVLFAAYLVGHLGQAIGNLVEEIPAVRKILQKKLPLSEQLGRLVYKAVSSRFGCDAKVVEAREIYQLCDQTLIHHGSLGEREIFTYREGFYRGNCVALSFLALALIVRLLRAPAKLSAAQATVELGWKPLMLGAALTSVGAGLAFRRYVRFAEHRIRSSLLRFLASATARSADEKGKTDG